MLQCDLFAKIILLQWCMISHTDQRKTTTINTVGTIALNMVCELKLFFKLYPLPSGQHTPSTEGVLCSMALSTASVLRTHLNLYFWQLENSKKKRHWPFWMPLSKLAEVSWNLRVSYQPRVMMSSSNERQDFGIHSKCSIYLALFVDIVWTLLMLFSKRS